MGKTGATKKANSAKCRCKDVDLGLLHDILESADGGNGSLISILQEAQNLYGYLPEPVIEEISKSTGVPLSRVFGVATFYSQFRLRKQGKTAVKVCHGTACHVSGARGITDAVSDELGVEEGETTVDRKFTLESVACLGCCGLAPVMTIGEKTYGALTPEKAREVMRQLNGGGDGRSES